MNFLNLISNGGFRQWGEKLENSWEIATPQNTEARRVAIPDFNSSGLPKTAYALQVTCLTNEKPSFLEQKVPLPQERFNFFAFRIVAKNIKKCRNLEILVCHEKNEIQRFCASLTHDWQRFRFAFSLPQQNSTANEITIRINIPSVPGASFLCTNIQLVNVERAEPIESLTFRFDTFGTLTKASSRLRAWALEDILNLLGYKTSVNGGENFDIYICQKTRPWRKAKKAKQAGKIIIYDLDDNDLARTPRMKKDIERFLHLADGATAGSPFLYDILSKLNPEVFLLENPVDVLEREIAHNNTVCRGKLVWFGAPENLWMLKCIKLHEPVTTITQDGDIEYELKTIDEHLIQFDLALLPVELNEATRAKNANRLIKCVGLGLPFLASETPEHKRALEQLQLPVDFLVTDERDWEKRIQDVAARYMHYKTLIQNARDIAFEIYGMGKITHEWLDFVKKLQTKKRVRTSDTRKQHWLKRIFGG